MIGLAIASGISGGITVIGLYIRLRYLDKRDEREKERFEFAARQLSDVYYRGGVKDAHVVGDVLNDLLRTTRPERRRRLGVFRRDPNRQPQLPPPERAETPPPGRGPDSPAGHVS